MLERNFLIINRSPQSFAEMKAAGRTMVFIGEDGKVLDYGAIAIDDAVYAMLYCDEVRNITMVIDRDVRKVVTVLWCTDEGYRRGFGMLSRAYDEQMSEQNLRINRYAEAIADKLDHGVRLRVTDAVNESEMVKCPECGILNPAGSKYCLDCGADISI